jgi:hypothetical protein
VGDNNEKKETMSNPRAVIMPAGVRVFIAASAVFVLLTLLLAALTGLGLSLPRLILAAAGAGLALAGAVFAWQSQRAGQRPEMLGVLLGGVPALLAVGMSQLVHWDDFMTWMANARTIYDFGLPAYVVPGTVSRWAAYPPAASLAVAAVWAVLGHVLDTAPQILNVLALLILPGLLLWEAGPVSGDRRVRVAAAALLALAVTLGNPSLDWHWVFSGCPDALLGVTVAVGAVLARRLWLDRACPAEGETARAVALGAVLALMVALKQTGLVTFALLAGAVFLARGLAGGPRRSWRRFAILAALTVLPALLTQIVWRSGLPVGGAPIEMGFRPYSAWMFHVLPMTLAAAGAEMADRWLETLPMLLAAVVGLVVLARGLAARIRRVDMPVTPAEQASAVFAVLWVGFSVFLVAANIGAFSEREAVRAAEWHRYQAQVAQFGMLTAALWLWERRSVLERRLPAIPAAVPAVIVLALVTGATVATGLDGAPRPILGRHWAGVLDGAEVGRIRAAAAHAAHEAMAAGAGSVTVAIRPPRAMTRPDQMSPWHIQALAGLVAGYEIWSARTADPLRIERNPEVNWRALDPLDKVYPQGYWRARAQGVALVFDDGEGPGAAVWVQRSGDWTCAGRHPIPRSLEQGPAPVAMK